MENNEKVPLIIETLRQLGIVEWCLCAGKRDVPIVDYLYSHTKDLLSHHVDERSAGFYALGVIKKTNKPVVVVTTSGTASGELLPAMMEAYYAGLPLIALTADRPQSFRFTNSPQTANQKKIFGFYAEVSIDCEDFFELPPLSLKKPIHINLCLDEKLEEQRFQTPLMKDVSVMDSDIIRLREQRDVEEKQLGINLIHMPSSSAYPFSHAYKLEDQQSALESFLSSAPSVVVILGGISPFVNKKPLVSFLKNLRAPIYIEAQSQLSAHPDLQEIRLRNIDFLKIELQNTQTSVLRIGHIPTHRIWRDLEEELKETFVFSLDDLPFSGLTRGVFFYTDLELFFLDFKSKIKKENKKLKEKSDRIYSNIEQLLLSFPLSEQAFVNRISSLIPTGSTFYLGNSLPIRLWDLVSEKKDLKHYVSRGLNGIDGQISCFFGVVENSGYALFGDLTTIYDLNSLWILKQKPHINVKIIVMNNGGGQIFSSLKKPEQAVNSHSFSFEHWAKMFSCDYGVFSDPSILHFENEIIELTPSQVQTDSFTKAHALFLKEEI